MTKKDTKYLKFNGSSWVFQKRLKAAESLHLGVKTKVHNRTLETDSLTEAQAKRDGILMQLSQANEQSKSPKYSALLEKYQGYSHEKIREALDKTGDSLSDNYSYLSHLEYKGDMEEPTELEMLDYETLRVLAGKQPENSIKDKHRLNLSDAFAAVKEEKIELPSKNIKTYERSIKIFLSYMNLDDVQMNTIDRFLVRKFIAYLKKQFAPSSMRTITSNLAVIWDYARDAERYVIENPFRGHGIPARDKNTKFYTDWKIKELHLILKNISSSNDKLPIYIAWYTGSRLDEVYSLQPDHIFVDEETGVKVMSFKPELDGKNVYATRLVPVHAALESLISGFNGWNRSSSDAYGKYFGAVKKKLGFEDRRKAFHSIRGNTSTNFENLKIPEHIANKIVGHKSRGATMTYGYYSQGPGLVEAKQAVNLLPVL